MGSLPHILIINPNTSTNVSTMIEAVAREVVGDAATISMVTARFGFDYISTRTAVAVAAHAVLDAAASALEESPTRPDVIVLGCFGDPGRDALAEMTDLPVMGFAEAGFAAAAEHHGRTLLATSGAIWCEMLHELVLKSDLAGKIAGIRSIEDVTGDAEVGEFLTREAKHLGATQIVLGGAGLIPRLPKIADNSEISVVDPHRLTFRKVLGSASRMKSTADSESRRLGTASGLSPALLKVVAQRG